MSKIKIGVDEVGRGPWLGPVVAAAFCFNSKNMPSKKFISKITDSKKISEKKREEIFSELINMSISTPGLKSGGLKSEPKIFFGIGVVDNFIIDDINIRQANKEAMRRSIIELLRKIDRIIHPSIPSFKSKGKEVEIEVVIDGRDNYEFEELKNKPEYIIKGDSKVVEIGAASIIAKVFRDNLMKTYSMLYPDLGLENHKGYGTKKHIEYLSNKSKVTGIHRLSYKPIKECLENNLNNIKK